jgi:zinc transport system substrate-binding protein
MHVGLRPPAALLAGGLLAGAFLAGGCSTRVRSGDTVAVVATVYPLAWLVQAVGGDRVSVLDLTPPGVDAHDAVLTARQRADIETANLVVYLGDIGFQPDVEAAVADANGTVLNLGANANLIQGEGGVAYDPHAWLDPERMVGFASEVAAALEKTDPQHRSAYAAREATVTQQLTSLDQAFREGLSGCRYTTFVASHEAFAYLAQRYGLTQIGIQGLVPESEPSADRIHAAESAITSGEAAPVVFYENTDEGQRIADSIAADVSVPTLPLGTLEAAPPTGDYLSVMRGNLTNLREGLRCP